MDSHVEERQTGSRVQLHAVRHYLPSHRLTAVEPEILVVFKFGGLAPNQLYKILAGFKFGGGVSGPFIKEQCHLSLEALEQSHEFANLLRGSRVSTVT